MRAFLAALMLCAASAASAQPSDIRAACTGDVLRLCDAATIAHAAAGDHSGVIACFHAHRRELSRACALVLSKFRR
jgi:hypothetical protein